MGEFETTPEYLYGYAEYMRGLADTFAPIGQFVATNGCGIEGFTGVLEVLHPAVTAVSGFYVENLQLGEERLRGSAEGLDLTADEYEATDSDNAASIVLAAEG